MRATNDMRHGGTVATPRIKIRAGFHALGTEIALYGIGIDQTEMTRALALAVRLAERWEQTFSRFRPDSELCRLNAAGGRPSPVSSDLLWMIETARDAYARTHGRFDPTILPALETAGYDRDFFAVRDRAEPVEMPAAAHSAPGMTNVWIDAAHSRVTLPPGLRLDLGGIAKGAFVDRLALALMNWPGGCVDAGGDLRVWGQPPDGEHWVIGIEHPESTGTDLLAVIVLDERAAGIATSAINRRHWRMGAATAHHLIDPASGRPAVSSLLACTALDASVVAAEVATKSLFVGAAHGESPVVGDTGAVLIRAGGEVEVIDGSAPDAWRIVPVDTDAFPY